MELGLKVGGLLPMRFWCFIIPRRLGVMTNEMNYRQPSKQAVVSGWNGMEWKLAGQDVTRAGDPDM